MLQPRTAARQSGMLIVVLGQCTSAILPVQKRLVGLPTATLVRWHLRVVGVARIVAQGEIAVLMQNPHVASSAANFLLYE